MGQEPVVLDETGSQIQFSHALVTEPRIQRTRMQSCGMFNKMNLDFFFLTSVIDFQGIGVQNFVF